MPWDGRFDQTRAFSEAAARSTVTPAFSKATPPSSVIPANAGTHFDFAPPRIPLAIAALLLLTLPISTSIASGKPPSGKNAVENRCGWFVNPTPANAWLIDRDGEWTIATQGGEQAEGDWPTIAEKQWVSYGHGSYGHGCACLRVVTDRENMQIKRIVSSSGKPLAQCRRDRKLAEPRE